MDLGLASFGLAASARRYEEDRQQRNYENWHRQLEEVYYAVEMKTEQLRSISPLAAFIAGFALMLLLETKIPHKRDAIWPPLWPIWGTCCVVVIFLNVIAVVMMSLMLVSVLNFDVHKSTLDGQLTWNEFWYSRCERDWIFAYRCFVCGLPLFVLSVISVAWIVYSDKIGVAIFVTILGAIVFCLIMCIAMPKYGAGDTFRRLPPSFAYGGGIAGNSNLSSMNNQLNNNNNNTSKRTHGQNNDVNV